MVFSTPAIRSSSSLGSRVRERHRPFRTERLSSFIALSCVICQKASCALHLSRNTSPATKNRTEGTASEANDATASKISLSTIVRVSHGRPWAASFRGEGDHIGKSNFASLLGSGSWCLAARRSVSRQNDLASADNFPTDRLMADATIQTSLWTKLAAAASAMSRSVGKLSAEARSFCRDTLLRAAKHQEPLPNKDAKFDFPMWSPSPRNEAAQGLPWLTLTIVDNEILDAVASLASDAVPSVRFLVAGEVFRLRWSAHEAFWQITQERAMKEDNRSVLNGLCLSLTRLPKDEDDRIAGVLNTIQGKGLFPSEKSDFGDTFAMIVTRLALSHENQWAMETLDTWRKSPDQHAELLHHAVFQAVLAINPSNLGSDKLRPTSLRAGKWLLAVLEGTVQTLQNIRPTDQAEWTEERTKKFKEAYTVVDEIVSRLYYNIRHREGTEEISFEATGDYYLTIKPLLQAVTLLGRRDQRGIVLAPTAHHFMQLMNEVLSYEPKAVLHMAADVAEASEAAGYNIDSIAIKEVVTLVESVLADYRNEVQEGEALADLLRLLDVFAKAGWPQALQLVWRLDEVFR